MKKWIHCFVLLVLLTLSVSFLFPVSTYAGDYKVTIINDTGKVQHLVYSYTYTTSRFDYIFPCFRPNKFKNVTKEIEIPRGERVAIMADHKYRYDDSIQVQGYKIFKIDPLITHYKSDILQMGGVVSYTISKICVSRLLEKEV